MKLLLFLLTTFTLNAQRVVTFDPEKDVLAHRQPDGSVQIALPAQALCYSIQEAMPAVSNIQIVGIQKIGKSNYLIADGKILAKPETGVIMAILLVETSPGSFQADDLVISCSSSGECRECSLPPLCKCTKGEGNCGQNATLMAPLKKVTVTLFD